jgi:hypothetical protein
MVLSCVYYPLMPRRFPISHDALAPYRERIGLRPRDRLTWALQLAQRPADGLTPGDWENVRGEIAAALEAAGYQDEAVQSVRLPDLEEARAIREGLATFFVRLLHGEEIRPLPSQRRPVYRFNRGSGLWQRWELGRPDSVDALLERLVPVYGHLIRECAAPRVRGASGQRCSVWFVATRSYQTFCSARCHNRAGARAFRAKAARKTPARRKRGPRRSAARRRERRPA